MKKDFNYSKASKVEITLNGKEYLASYFLEKGILTVVTAEHGQKSTQLGGLTAEILAKILLRELVER